MTENAKIKVIGAGLAGAEAAYQAARLGVQVELYEMKPHSFSPAHSNPNFAELVCSNSLRSNQTDNAVGLLKAELSRLGSLIMESAYQNEVPAGSALAVNRDGFSAYITEKIKSNPNITVYDQEVLEIDTGDITVVATGPLSSPGISRAISELTGGGELHFFDAAAPIVDFSTVDTEKAFFCVQIRKGKP